MVEQQYWFDGHEVTISAVLKSLLAQCCGHSGLFQVRSVQLPLMYASGDGISASGHRQSPFDMQVWLRPQQKL